MAPLNDPFPTTKLTVPYLADVLERLRDPKAKRLIVLCHSKSIEEGEWILATTAARLSRGGMKVVGPELTKATALMELALRERADAALVANIQSPEDAMAVRVACSAGLKIAGVISAPDAARFHDIVRALGPWTGYNLQALTRPVLPAR